MCYTVFGWTRWHGCRIRLVVTSYHICTICIVVRSTSLWWPEECCTTICDCKSFLIWCKKLCTITVVQKLEDWCLVYYLHWSTLPTLPIGFHHHLKAKLFVPSFPWHAVSLGFLTPRIFATLVFCWFAHAVANRCCICLLHLFGRATLCSQWPICVMIKFLQEHHNLVQLHGRTLCLEMLRNGLYASDGTWRKQCHSYQQLIHEGTLELLFW